MQLLSAQELDQTARQRLEYAQYDPRKLSVIHAGLSLAVTLLLTLIHFLLSRQIGSTAGLSGIGTRTALESVQYILQLAVTFALPFWEAGFLACALGLSRKRQITPSGLTAGFRRFGPLLRLWLLQGLLYFIVSFIAVQLGSILISLTPFASAMLESMDSILSDPAFLASGTISDAQIQQLLRSMLPVYAVAAIVFLVLAIPLVYRLRLAPYAIFEEDRPGALAAMRRSRAMMRGNCVAFFKVDLHFWWYYLLLLLAALVANLDILLPAVGISLPFGEDVALFLFYGLHLVVSLLIAWQFRSRIETTYACAYDSLLPKETAE